MSDDFMSAKELWDRAVLSVKIEREKIDTVRRSVTDDLRDQIHSMEEKLRDTSEDSYATRNELRDEISQSKWLIRRMERSTADRLDLTQHITDYGYDHEAAAADHACGLEYVKDFDRAKDVYEDSISRIGPVLDKLKRAGIKVETGVLSIDPEHDYGRDL